MRTFTHDGYVWEVEATGGRQLFPHRQAGVWFCCHDTGERVLGRVIDLDGGLAGLSDVQLAQALGIALRRQA
jgi:hypothetical protein